MNTKIKKMVHTALATAVICILGPFTIQIPISPVPISLTLFAIFLASYVLGLKWGLVSTALYILIGFIGIPVFSGLSGGAGKLLGPTGGYIIGYLFVAALSGLFIDRWENKRCMHVIGMVLGTILCYALGTFWLSYTAGMDLSSALYAGVIPFIPADAVKIAVATMIGPRIRATLSLLASNS